MRMNTDRYGEEGESGFTIVELLVVILIIGILAAIAIPAFLNQRKAAYDARLISDVKNAATQVQTHGTMNLDWQPTAGLTLGFMNLPQQVVAAANPEVQLSDGTTMELISYNNSNDFCLGGSNVYSASFTDGKFATWDATAGGLNKKGGSCPSDIIIGADENGNPVEDGTVALGGTGMMITPGSKGGSPFEATYTMSYTDSRLSGSELQALGDGIRLGEWAGSADYGIEYHEGALNAASLAPASVTVSGDTVTASFDLIGEKGIGQDTFQFKMTYTDGDGAAQRYHIEFPPGWGGIGVQGDLSLFTTDTAFSEATGIHWIPGEGYGGA